MLIDIFAAIRGIQKKLFTSRIKPCYSSAPVPKDERKNAPKRAVLKAGWRGKICSSTALAGSNFD
jgi:hypothetical protein